MLRSVWITAALAALAVACTVDLEEGECLSDSDCAAKGNTICKLPEGWCVRPAPDAEPTPDATPTPDAEPTPDMAVEADMSVEADMGVEADMELIEADMEIIEADMDVEADMALPDMEIIEADMELIEADMGIPDAEIP